MKKPLFTLYSLMIALSAGAVVAASGTPLMVVRFNTPKVHYQRQLYNAVSKAVAVKPSVMFDVVSFVPPSANADKAVTETSAFVADLGAIGIPKERIHTSQQTVSDGANHEIYLYVD